MKKFSFLLTIFLLLSSVLMTACNNQVPPDPPQGTTPEVTTPESETPLFDPTLSISLEQLANYEIVYAKDSSKEVKADVKKLATALYDAFDAIIGQRSDLYYEGVENLAKGQYEILIGDTNREESETFLSNLGWDDYGYAMVGDKLIIAGKNEDGTLEALRAFLTYIEDQKGSAVFFSNEKQSVVLHQYPHKNLTVNGISAKELSILCNQEELGGIAQMIRDAIIHASGVAVPIVTDEEIESIKNMIVVGDTSLTFITDEPEYTTGREYYVSTLAESIFIQAKTAAGYLGAVTELENLFLRQGGDDITVAYGKFESDDLMAVMSFNLMAGKESSRLDSVVGTILKYRPAIIGVQEATDMWIGLLKQRLGDLYTVVGTGRNADGGDEHSAILYLTAEFDCLESGTKWLSDTPDVAGSKFAESHYTRIMTYAHLSRKSDGKQFLHVNTHLDYGSTTTEEAVKVKQMQVVFDQIAKFSAIPGIITGDFNATFGSPVYKQITETACYLEAAAHIPAAERTPTYHGLMGTTGAPSHIDFIFHKDMAYSSYYRICTERVDNENVSDHYPVMAVLAFRPEGK